MNKLPLFPQQTPVLDLPVTAATTTATTDNTAPTIAIANATANRVIPTLEYVTVAAKPVTFSETVRPSVTPPVLYTVLFRPHFPLFSFLPRSLPP